MVCVQASDPPGPEGGLGQSEDPRWIGWCQQTAEATLPGDGSYTEVRSKCSNARWYSHGRFLCPYEHSDFDGTAWNFFIALRLERHWINTMFLSLQRTLGICGGEHSRSSLSYDAQMISQKAESVLIDSYFMIYTITWALGARSWWKNKVLLNLNWQNRHKPVSEVYLKSSSWLALLIFLCLLVFKGVPIIYTCI